MNGAMADFDYIAIAGDGRTLRGRIEAADPRAAAQRLQQIGHLPVEVRPAGESAPAARQLSSVPR